MAEVTNDTEPSTSGVASVMGSGVHDEVFGQLPLATRNEVVAAWTKAPGRGRCIQSSLFFTLDPRTKIDFEVLSLEGLQNGQQLKECSLLLRVHPLQPRPSSSLFYVEGNSGCTVAHISVLGEESLMKIPDWWESNKCLFVKQKRRLRLAVMDYLKTFEQGFEIQVKDLRFCTRMHNYVLTLPRLFYDKETTAVFEAKLAIRCLPRLVQGEGVKGSLIRILDSTTLLVDVATTVRSNIWECLKAPVADPKNVHMWKLYNHCWNVFHLDDFLAPLPNYPGQLYRVKLLSEVDSPLQDLFSEKEGIKYYAARFLDLGMDTILRTDQLACLSTSNPKLPSMLSKIPAQALGAHVYEGHGFDHLTGAEHVLAVVEYKVHIKTVEGPSLRSNWCPVVTLRPVGSFGSDSE